MANKAHRGIKASSKRKGAKSKNAQIPSSASCPIRDLPLEILSTIFAWAMVDSWLSSTSCCGDLLDLMLVCSQWRDAAQSSPIVWSTITVSLQVARTTRRPRRGALRHWARQLAVVETYLRRSGQAPLKISISGRELLPADEIVQRLVAHSFRWESLNIQLSLVNTIKNMPSVVRGNIPRLTTLTLTHNEFEFVMDRFSVLNHDLAAFAVFEDAPSLHTVEFDSWPKPATMKLPWSQIHHLSAHNMTPNDCIQLLNIAPTITSCEFTMKMLSMMEMGEPMATHCVVVHLQSLTLVAATPFLSISMLTDILHSVTFPSLTILEIHGCQIGSNTTFRDFDGALLAFILRSTCPLDRLKLHEVPLSKDGLAKVFVLLRSLRCLEIDGFNATSPGSRLDIDFLRGLAHPDNSNGVRSLPHLNRFSLSCSSRKVNSVSWRMFWSLDVPLLTIHMVKWFLWSL